MRTATAALVSSVALTALLSGCKTEGCLRGTDPECVVPSPCPDLAFTCDDSGPPTAKVIEPGDVLPGGPDALAAVGDILLENGRVQAVIDALDHPHYIAPTGGSLLDLATTGDDNDALRNLFQATGLLPSEAAHYTEMRILDEPGVAAVQFSGTLDGFEDVKIYTRYELRPCDEGVRIRTEVVHRGTDPLVWWLADAQYWGGREHLPFVPFEGAGFEHPTFGLSTVADAIREIPFLAAGAHVQPGATYAEVSCDSEFMYGFQSDEVSANGKETRIVMPRDFEVFERFVAVADGPSVSGAADIALEVRRQLYDERVGTLQGRLDLPDGDPGTLGDLIRASLIVSEGGAGTRKSERIPWTHAVPDANGRFSVDLPADRTYLLEVHAFGRVVAREEVRVPASGADLGEIRLPPVGAMTVNVTLDGVSDLVNVFVHPSNDRTEGAVTGALYGQFEECAPLLGNPWGRSPACNRVLVDGATKFPLLPGRYNVYASAGPFQTIARARDVEVVAGATRPVSLALETLPLQPDGTLTGDFHVHGRASFDSSLPDLDRVRSFLSAQLDVIASTDHDVVNDYAAAVTELGITDELAILVGVETTGHILFPLIEDDIFPKVIGHWNAWPIPYDPDGPYRGAPWDELVEPGGLFTRFEEQGWPPQTGVIQLNHPWGGLQFGRDFGWATASGLDLTEPLPAGDDGTTQAMYQRTPPGAAYANDAYDAQEVMNGTNNGQFLQYRAVWHYLLNQGVPRAGTANSDSHTLTDNVLGTPRNIVWTDTTLDAFDPDAFNAAVREGRILGTNGPIIEATLTDASGTPRTPSLEAFEPAGDAELEILVRAAPWVPVDGVRVIVNGSEVQRWEQLPVPADPFGTADLVRLDTSIPLAELVSGGGDAWIVIEAGTDPEPNEDLNCDGVPDTGDNNRDGRVDHKDVEELEDEEEAPEEFCFEEVGPFTEAEPPEDRNSAAYHFHAVVPKGVPSAFTNPFLLDRDGGGWTGAR